MITMTDFGKVLRTGNFLFQYASLLGLSRRYNTELCMPSNFMFNYFENPPIICDNLKTDMEVFEINHYYDPEHWNQFSEDFKNKTVNFRLNSFLQSPKYWEDNKDFVIEKLRFKPELIEAVRIKYAEALSRKTIGISIRRGDFVNHGVFYQIPVDFYMASVKKYFNDYEDYNLIFFSDDPVWIRENFKGPNIYYSDGDFTGSNYNNDPMEQLIYGSLCDNFVISNSTFSWWLGYYAVNMKNSDGKVIHCGHNLTNNVLNSNPDDYYHQDWISNK